MSLNSVSLSQVSSYPSTFPIKLKEKPLDKNNSRFDSLQSGDLFSQQSTKGQAEVKVAFWGGSDSFAKVSTIPKIHGLAQGDTLIVKGTGINGHLNIQHWSQEGIAVETELEGGILATLVEKATGKEPLTKNGKIKLALNVSRQNGHFSYALMDANQRQPTTLLSGPVDVLEDSKGTKIRLKTETVEMTININQATVSRVSGNGEGSLSIGFISLPIPGFSFEKK